MDENERIRRINQLPSPKPSLGLDVYEAIIQKSLDSNVERKANHDLMVAHQDMAKIDHLPVRLDFENVSRCNFRCVMCVVSDWPKGRRADDMSLESYKQIIDQQVGLTEIKIQGLGEPLLQGDILFDMIRYAREKDIWVRTITNGSLLHLKDNYKKLVDSGVNEIQISIDGADKETFEKIRQGSNYPQVAENCRLINAYCKEKKVNLTKMWVVMQDANAHQLEDFVTVAADMGFASMVLSLSVWGWVNDEWETRNSEIRVVDKIDLDILPSIVERGKKLGVDVTFWLDGDKYSVKNKRLCPWPFERAYISSDMRVVPCCNICDPKISDFGDAHDLTTAWRSPEYVQFRQDHLDGNIPKICKGCYED